MSAGDWKDFYKAACDGDLGLVRYYVDSGIDLDYAHPEFFSTALVGSIRARQAEVALYLLDRGASPSLISEIDDMTPIEAARIFAMPVVEARLLELGAVPPAVKGAGWMRWWPFARQAPR